jgi:hypothetical protein
MEHPMQKLNDLSRSLAPLKPDGTLIAVIKMSQSSWLVAGIVPGVERQPRFQSDSALTNTRGVRLSAASISIPQKREDYSKNGMATDWVYVQGYPVLKSK